MSGQLTSAFGLTDALAQSLRALGQRMDADALAQSRSLFASGHDFALPVGAVRHDDRAYGPDSRHRLDICQPAGTNLPAILFVPGGGFSGGDKRFYAHIPYYFARQGCVGVAMNYRLAPDHVWPCAGQDVASAIDWLVDNGAELGIDSSRVAIVAQSAGAAHAATALFDKRYQPHHSASIRAAVLMSGIYHVHAGMGSPNATAYFGLDSPLYPDRSALQRVGESGIPVTVTLAEYDPAYLVAQAADLVTALTARDGRSPAFAWLQGHNHVSPVLGLGGRGDRLGDAILHHLEPYLNLVV